MASRAKHAAPEVILRFIVIDSDALLALRPVGGSAIKGHRIPFAAVTGTACAVWRIRGQGSRTRRVGLRRCCGVGMFVDDRIIGVEAGGAQAPILRVCVGQSQIVNLFQCIDGRGPPVTRNASGMHELRNKSQGGP